MRRLALLLVILTPFGHLLTQNTVPQAARTEVPVTTVMLFSSGVGYFEHAGTVRGNGSTELRFKTSQINDILKSLVLQDQDGGRVSTITYPSQDPLAKTLRSFQVDITSNPSLADLLNQLRGATVTIQSQGERLTGTILGVEVRRRAVERGDPVATPILNLLAGATIRSVDLQGIASLTLDDPRLQDELASALIALTQARDQDRKPVTINFAGAGQRRVRVGYVVETPIWKTSYRLLLADDTNRLQGWAIVENQTESDWNDVSLSLVSGRPISFVMDLYQPLYATRPTVVQEMFAGLRPQVYDGGIASSQPIQEFGLDARGSINGVVREASGGAPLESAQVSLAGTVFGALTDAAGRFAIANVNPGTYTVQVVRVGYSPARRENVTVSVGRQSTVDIALSANALRLQAIVTAGGVASRGDMDMAESVQSIAQAARMGELFQYTIGNVTLARQKSAMLPIITDSITVERLTIYNGSVLPKNPLNGVRLKNTTGKHLLQGPVTVLDGNSYAGDARIDNVPPGQDRLISYGIDLEMLVDNTKSTQKSEVVTGRIVKGLMVIDRRQVSSQEYLADNKSNKDKMLVIEHPIRDGWKLVNTPKPLETTHLVYRFQGNAAPGKVTALTVKEETVRSEMMAILTGDIAPLVTYSRTGEIPAAVREALARAIQLRQAIVDTERQIAERTQKITEITQEQNRIRENMKTVAQTAQYYERLLAKLNEQESLIETLQRERDDLMRRRQVQRKELEDYLANLTVG